MFGLGQFATNISSGVTLTSLAPIIEALINLASTDPYPAQLITCLDKIPNDYEQDITDIRNLRRALIAFREHIIKPQIDKQTTGEEEYHDCQERAVSEPKLLQQQFLALALIHALNPGDIRKDDLEAIITARSETDLAKSPHTQVYDIWKIIFNESSPTDEQLAILQNHTARGWGGATAEPREFHVRFITGKTARNINQTLGITDPQVSIQKIEQPPPIAKFLYQIIQLKGNAEKLQSTDNPYLYNFASLLIASSSQVLHDILMDDTSTLLEKGPQIALALLAQSTTGSLTHQEVKQLQAHILSHDRVEQLTTFILSIMSKDFTQKALTGLPALPQAAAGKEADESYVAAFISSMVDRLSTDLKDKEIPALEKLCAFILLKVGALPIDNILDFLAPLKDQDPRVLVIETLRVISSNNPTLALETETPRSWSHALSNSTQAALANFVPATKNAESLEQQLLQLLLKSCASLSYYQALELVKAIQSKHPNPLNQRLALLNIVMQPNDQGTVALPERPLEPTDEAARHWAATVIQRIWRHRQANFQDIQLSISANEDPLNTLLSNLLLRADPSLSAAPTDARLRLFAYLLSRYQKVSPEQSRQLLDTFKNHENATQIKTFIAAMLSKNPKAFVQKDIKPEEATNTLIMHMVSTIFDYTADAPTLTQQCIQIVLNTSNVPEETINGFCKAIEASPAKDQRIALLAVIASPTPTDACQRFINLHHDDTPLTTKDITRELVRNGIQAGFPEAQEHDSIETQFHYMAIKTLLPEDNQDAASEVIAKLEGFDQKTKRIALLTILTANNSLAACQTFINDDELTPAKVNTILLNSLIATGMPETKELSLFQKGLYTLTQTLSIAPQEKATRLLENIKDLDRRTQAVIVARCALSENPENFVANLQIPMPLAESDDQKQQQQETYKEHLRGIIGDLSNEPIKEQMSQTVTTLTILLMALYVCLSIIAGTHMFFGLGIAATQVGLYVGCSTAAALTLQFITYKLIQYQYRVTQKIHQPAKSGGLLRNAEAKKASQMLPEGSMPQPMQPQR